MALNWKKSNFLGRIHLFIENMLRIQLSNLKIVANDIKKCSEYKYREKEYVKKKNVHKYRTPHSVH